MAQCLTLGFTADRAGLGGDTGSLIPAVTGCGDGGFVNQCGSGFIGVRIAADRAGPVFHITGGGAGCILGGNMGQAVGMLVAADVAEFIVAEGVKFAGNGHAADLTGAIVLGIGGGDGMEACLSSLAADGTGSVLGTVADIPGMAQRRAIGEHTAVTGLGFGAGGIDPAVTQLAAFGDAAACAALGAGTSGICPVMAQSAALGCAAVSTGLRSVAGCVDPVVGQSKADVQTAVAALGGLRAGCHRSEVVAGHGDGFLNGLATIGTGPLQNALSRTGGLLGNNAFVQVVSSFDALGDAAAGTGSGSGTGCVGIGMRTIDGCNGFLNGAAADRAGLGQDTLFRTVGLLGNNAFIEHMLDSFGILNTAHSTCAGCCAGAFGVAMSHLGKHHFHLLTAHMTPTNLQAFLRTGCLGDTGCCLFGHGTGQSLASDFTAAPALICLPAICAGPLMALGIAAVVTTDLTDGGSGTTALVIVAMAPFDGIPGFLGTGSILKVAFTDGAVVVFRHAVLGTGCGNPLGMDHVVLVADRDGVSAVVNGVGFRIHSNTIQAGTVDDQIARANHNQLCTAGAGDLADGQICVAVQPQLQIVDAQLCIGVAVAAGGQIQPVVVVIVVQIAFLTAPIPGGGGKGIAAVHVVIHRQDSAVQGDHIGGSTHDHIVVRAVIGCIVLHQLIAVMGDGISGFREGDGIGLNGTIAVATDIHRSQAATLMDQIIAVDTSACAFCVQRCAITNIDYSTIDIQRIRVGSSGNQSDIRTGTDIHNRITKNHVIEVAGGALDIDGAILESHRCIATNTMTTGTDGNVAVMDPHFAATQLNNCLSTIRPIYRPPE